MLDLPAKGLNRYAAVLDAVSTHPMGLSLLETAKVTGLPKSTVHRNIRALIEVGYLSEGRGHTSYRLGPRLLRMLHLGMDVRSLESLFRPALQRLVETLDNTVYVSKLVGWEVLPVSIVVPDRLCQANIQPGRLMPVHAAASAKAIVAFQDDKTIGRFLERPMVRYTVDTLTGVREVRAHLKTVRERGFADCVNELDEGVMALAVPVVVDGIGVLYSVGVCGLLSRMRRHKRASIVEELRQAASEIAGLLSQVGQGEPGAVGAAR